MERKKLTQIVILIIAILLISLLTINLEVQAVFTYGNWTWDGTNKILSINANATNNEGNSEANAYDYEDIVNSGVVPSAYFNVSASKKQFEFDFTIRIADLSIETWFIDKDKQITFTSTSGSGNSIIIRIYAQGHFIMGELINQTLKTTKNGVFFIFLTTRTEMIRQETNADVKLYSSSFVNPLSTSKYLNIKLDSPVWNCMSDNVRILTFGAGSVNFYNLDTTSNINQVGFTGSGDRIFTFENEYACGVSAFYSYTMKNVLARGNSYVTAGFRNQDFYLVNWDSDNWLFGSAIGGTGEIYRQYEFSLTVSFSNGTVINGTKTGTRVVIQHYGENKDIDYNATLGEKGSIPIQTLTKAFFNQTGGNSPYSYEPYNLYVYNTSGYESYNQNFTISQKTSWEIVLTPTPTDYSTVFLAIGLSIGICLIVVTGVKIKK